MPDQPIVWELGLTVGTLIVFAVWQGITLRRDRRITQKRRHQAEAAALAGTKIAEPSAPTPPDFSARARHKAPD